jgi:hypothetical protein
MSGVAETSRRSRRSSAEKTSGRAVEEFADFREIAPDQNIVIPVEPRASVYSSKLTI